jgi:hypothetical protein
VTEDVHVIAAVFANELRVIGALIAAVALHQACSLTSAARCPSGVISYRPSSRSTSHPDRIISCAVYNELTGDCRRVIEPLCLLDQRTFECEWQSREKRWPTLHRPVLKSRRRGGFFF